MMFARYLLLWVADILANAAGYCLNPIFAFWPVNLPYYLRWFQTYDADLNGFQPDGRIESRFITQTRWLRDGLTPKNSVCAYFCRLVWLYRNNAYGFAYTVLGATGPFVLVTWFGTQDVSDRHPAKAGFCYFKWGAGERTYFHIRWVKPWGFGKCWEANIGWKIAADSKQAQFVFRVWPFRAFEK